MPGSMTPLTISVNTMSMEFGFQVSCSFFHFSLFAALGYSVIATIRTLVTCTGFRGSFLTGLCHVLSAVKF